MALVTQGKIGDPNSPDSRLLAPHPYPHSMEKTTARPSTVGELRASGWRDRTVKEELRHNVIERLRNGLAIVRYRIPAR